MEVMRGGRRTNHQVRPLARSLVGAGGGAGQTVLRARAAATATVQKSPKRAGRSRSVAALSEGKAFRRSLAVEA